MLSASGGGLRIIEEQQGPFVGDYDDDYKFTITLPANSVLIYFIAGPGDPEYDEATYKTPLYKWMLGGTRERSMSYSYTHSFYDYKMADITFAIGKNSATLEVVPSGDYPSNFYISSYKVLGL